MPLRTSVILAILVCPSGVRSALPEANNTSDENTNLSPTILTPSRPSNKSRMRPKNSDLYCSNVLATKAKRSASLERRSLSASCNRRFLRSSDATCANATLSSPPKLVMSTLLASSRRRKSPNIDCKPPICARNSATSRLNKVIWR